jgi:molybdenum-dependent DNA-binding transcriptional regulator ModE
MDKADRRRNDAAHTCGQAFADEIEVRLILAAVCLHGSMLSASQYLGVSGPTIRRLIQEAEKKAGVSLVRATAKGTALTVDGLRTIGLER